MRSARVDVKAALAAYRSHVASRNRQVLEVYVPFIAAAETDLDDGEDLVRLRMESLRGLLSADEDCFAELGIATPGECAEQAREGMRSKMWGAYFDVVLRELRRTCLEEVWESIGVPEELQVLAEEVDAVDGPGLAKDRTAFFWWGLKDRLWGTAAAGREFERRTAERVMMPTEAKQMSGLGPGWEVAGGWELGEGREEGWFCAVYCRRAGDEGGWRWRYTFVSQWDYSSRVFGSVAKFLGWYCTFNEGELPRAEELNADDILAGLF
ncbi:hypothetical protein CGLO_03125 [Colletotrichum gloeosporioides Cg-14]|uniref:Uncharacterized protein n=1 Tax=Colletotrichum gloeosporioides (strain Cg-14) TaxID=1237896 RepID=T0KMH1_COLGC|nr:hypothetical protein CGLO_03125 [Colletotrichum gloeosporioides Cg-14]